IMSNAARYLIFFQYIGTKYSISAHSFLYFSVFVQDAIRRLRPLNPASLSVSSRTDAGVHALSNSAHFDLQRKNDKPPFTEDVLVQALNYHLKTEQIRVTHAHRVSDDFHARYSAQSRTYIYRIALGLPHYSALPLVDCQLCWNLRNTELDVEAMREAAAMLVGTHDFSTFRAVNSDMPFKSPVKTLDLSCLCVCMGEFYILHQDLTFWEICLCTFLLKSNRCCPGCLLQVRRMTGALVAVGQRQLSLPQLREIMEARDSLIYPQGLAAPAYGLFLTRVEYRETGESV
uniref:tRNA pseudouridine synthase n=1 Tax=Stegastes partitus TaxID=144197 RepID=A0A3B4ZNN5_9TELE